MPYNTSTSEATREAYRAKKAAELALDFVREESPELVKARLRDLIKSIDCKDFYEQIPLTPPKENKRPQSFPHIDYDIDFGINKILNTLLDELMIGGCQLHRSQEIATQHNEKNCYVWDKNKLYYIPLEGEMLELELNIPFYLFTDQLNALTPNKRPSTTQYLSAEQIMKLIRTNTLIKHKPTPKEQKSDYLNSPDCPNLYAALKKLSKKHRHLEFLVELIDKTKKKHTLWRYTIAAAGVIGMGSALFYLKNHIQMLQRWFDKAIPAISRFLSNTVYVLRNTPIIGILANGWPLLSEWYHAIQEDSFNNTTKNVKLGFKTLEHTLPIIGYVLCYLAAGVMTWPAFCMFGVGSLIDIVETAYTLRAHELERRNNPLPAPLTHLSKAQHIRRDKMRSLDRYVFAINLTANIVIALTVFIWAAFPPSLVVALPCVGIAWLMGITKNSLTAHLKENHLKVLQEDLSLNNSRAEAEIKQREIVHQMKALPSSDSAAKLIQSCARKMTQTRASSPVFFTKTTLKSTVSSHRGDSNQINAYNCANLLDESDDNEGYSYCS